MIKASVFKKLGGWDETLVEDMAFAGKLLKNDYIIAHDPRSTVFTHEPENLKEFYYQRFRWGKGGAFAFIRYKEVYMRLNQVIIGMIPHALLSMMLIFLILYQVFFTIYYLVPFSTLINLSFMAFIRLLYLISLFFSAYWVPVMLATLTHTLVFSFKGIQRVSEIVLMIPYVFIYIPILYTIYAIGITAGVLEKIKNGSNAKELDFKDWKK